MLAFAATLAIGLGTAHAADDSRYLAAGFTALAHDARIVVMPIDVELSSISAGGVNEPKADWTAAARDNMKTTLDDRVSKLGLNAQFMDDSAAE